MSFFKIVPRDEGFLNDYSNAISLRVVKDDGISTTPKIDIKVTDLNDGYEHVRNISGKGIKFKVKVIIKKTDKVRGVFLTDLLDSYIRNMTPLLVSTDAIDIPSSGQYLIIGNDNRLQSDELNTIWELEFMTYTPLSLFKYANNNTAVKNAIAKTKKKKTNATLTKLKKCGYKNLKYSKKKKVVKCVKVLQQVLYMNKVLKKSQITGWYNKTTKAAVKKYQKNYNKKHVTSKTSNNMNGILVTSGTLVTDANNPNISLPANTTLSNATTNTGATKVSVSGINKLLPTNGKVDKATWKALYKGE